MASALCTCRTTEAFAAELICQLATKLGIEAPKPPSEAKAWFVIDELSDQARAQRRHRERQRDWRRRRWPR
jgi:hypothetical protein